MSIKAIEAEVYIQSGVEACAEISDCSVEADVEIGREVIFHEKPVLESLEATGNGWYEPQEGIDGFSDVTVSIPVYDGETEITPVNRDILLDTDGKIIDGNMLIHKIPRVPHTVIVSGSFVKTGGSGVTYTLDTGNTDWTHLLIRPHDFPYDDLTTSQKSIAIMSKYIDVNLDSMFTAYMSAAGNAYNSGSWKRISDGTTCVIENGVVHMTGESSTTGKWINNKQYDWWAWGDDPEEIQEPNVFRGEFTATETGVITIDTGYTGEEYPKAIVITPVDGLMTAEFLSAAQKSSNYRFVINYYAGFKTNTNTPVYDSEETDSAIRNYLVYMDSANKYTASYNTRYPFKSDDPVAGVNVLRIPDNRHIKIWCAKNRSGTGTYFWANIKYHYCVYY